MSADADSETSSSPAPPSPPNDDEPRESDREPAAPGGGRAAVWARRLAVAGALLLLLLLAAPYVLTYLFLHTDRGLRLLNRNPERFEASWDAASSSGLGKIHVEGLALRGSTLRQDWWVHIDEADGRVDLLGLLSQAFTVRGVEARGFRLRIERRETPGPPRRDKGPGWKLAFTDFTVDEVRDLDLKGYRLRGSGRGSGTFRQQIRGEMELDDLRLEMPGGELLIQGMSAARLEELDFAVSNEPFRPRDHRGLDGLPFLSVDLKALRGTVESLGFANYYLSRVEWLDLSGRGEIEGSGRLERGALAAPSRFQVTSDEVAASFLDYHARGAGSVSFQVDEEEGAPRGLLDVLFRSFSVKRSGFSAPHVMGEGLHLTAVSRDLDLRQPFTDLVADVEVPRSQVPDLAIYNAYIPDKAPLTLGSGAGTIEGKLHLSAAEESARGDLLFRASGARVVVGEMPLTGNLRIETHLSDDNLAERRFGISGSRARFDEVIQRKADGELLDRPPWWGEVEVKKGWMSWREPLTLDAHLSARLRDSGPVVRFFTADRPLLRLAGRLIKAEDISGEADVDVDPGRVRVENLRVTGDDIELRANLLFANGDQRGRLYTRYKNLDAALELLPGKETDLHLTHSKAWFEGRKDPD